MADWDWGGAGGGAAKGAVAGSMFGPWGTGIGAVAGGLFGGFSGGQDSGGAGQNPFLVNTLGPLLDSGQEDEIIRRLMSFNDLPSSPLGQQSRQLLQQRMSPDFMPQFFRNETLNPFLQAQFRLGREQLGRDVTQAQDQFQRMGAYFSPDLPQFTNRLTERQNLAEQDFLGNLGFRGAEVAEQLRTDALARALGLESVTGGVLDQLIGRQNQREATELGFFGGLQGGEGTETQSDPLGFLSGILGGGGGSDIFGRVGQAFGGSQPSGGADGVVSQDWQQMLFELFKQDMLPT